MQHQAVYRRLQRLCRSSAGGKRTAGAAAKAKPVAAAKPAEEPAKKKMTYGERLELERLDQEIARSEAELKMLGAEINQCGSDLPVWQI